MARAKDNATKLLIADAAEMLFARHGFHAASVRDIFKEANVNQGLMAYYFHSKDELYAFVVDRRMARLKEVFTAGFPPAKSDGRATPPATYIAYYLSFFLINALVERDELSNYILLLAKSASDYENESVKRSLSRFDFITEKMASALLKAAPFISPDQVRGTLLYLEAAVTTLLVSRGLREHRLGEGNERELIEQLIGDMTAFFARGFLR